MVCILGVQIAIFFFSSFFLGERKGEEDGMEWDGGDRFPDSGTCIDYFLMCGRNLNPSYVCINAQDNKKKETAEKNMSPPNPPLFVIILPPSQST